jgi:hypothetical protein
MLHSGPAARSRTTPRGKSNASAQRSAGCAKWEPASGNRASGSAQAGLCRMQRKPAQTGREGPKRAGATPPRASATPPWASATPPWASATPPNLRQVGQSPRRRHARLRRRRRQGGWCGGVEGLLLLCGGRARRKRRHQARRHEAGSGRKRRGAGETASSRTIRPPRDRPHVRKCEMRCVRVRACERARTRV